jgi:hypothetical protein
MIEPNDLPIVCLPTGLPDQAAAEVLHFLQELAAAFERQYAGQIHRYYQARDERSALRDDGTTDHGADPF